MAEDFQEAYESVLDYINRPAAEMAVQAKREVNYAMRWMNRRYQFLRAEATEEIQYSAGNFTVDINSLLSVQTFGVITAQLVQAGQTEGIPIDVLSYNDIQRRRAKFDDQFGASNELEYVDSWQEQFRNSVKGDSRYLGFIQKAGFGLFPTPTVDLFLFVHHNERLPLLDDDADTNFITENCMDFLVLKAVSRMNLYLKEDDRVQISTQLMEFEWNEVENWDKSLRTSTPIRL